MNNNNMGVIGNSQGAVMGQGPSNNGFVANTANID